MDVSELRFYGKAFSDAEGSWPEDMRREMTHKGKAVEIAKAIMDATAREPMLVCLPRPENVRAFPDALSVFSEYFRAAVEPSRQAGSHEMEIVEDSDEAVQFNITWCVWLELARLMGCPEACLPNCYGDDIAFPGYFQDLGLTYGRTGTLANGADCCDFRISRREGKELGNASEE